MPGFTTHYIFGIDAFKRIPMDNIRSLIRSEHSAFSLGLQGPDLFFYYIPSHVIHTTNLGALAQERNTGAFFSHLLKARSLLEAGSEKSHIADAYISGFIGHYTLDCTCHPYIYAFTGYDPKKPKKDSQYFGQHAYLETELDKELLWRRKRLYPSQFHQDATIHLTLLQRKVIGDLLEYAFAHTYPSLRVSTSMIREAILWMEHGTRMMWDPTGQKKALVRKTEGFLIRRPYISAMFPSDNYTFVEDPMNYGKRTWRHPWTKEESQETFMDLYEKAGRLYDMRLKNYFAMVNSHFSKEARDAFCEEYGNRSFLSGLPLF